MSDSRGHARRLPLLLLAASLLCATAHARQSDAADARERHGFHLTITDSKGKPVSGVTRAEVAAFEGSEPCDVVSFGAGDVPTSVLFLIDASSSAFGMNMGKRRWRGMASLARSIDEFMEGSNSSNEYLVVAFNKSPQVILDGTTDREAVMAALERLAASDMEGGTALHDALYVSLNKLALRPTRRRVLLLFSDGLDGSSKYKLTDVMRALKESDVIVYPVGVFTNDEPYDSYISRSLFGELASASGGAVSYPGRGEELKSALMKIAAELRAQYAITVATPSRAKGDGWHEVRFELAGARDERGREFRRRVRARRGFYEAGAPRKR